MKQLFFALMIAAALVLNVGVENVQAGDFSFTCKAIKINGNMLTAICRTRAQLPNPTSINLDRCIENRDGKLTWGGPNFSQTCVNIKLDDTGNNMLLNANCKKINGNLIPASINLDQRIDNQDGRLVYK